MKNIILIFFAFALCINGITAQRSQTNKVTVSPWMMHQGKGVIPIAKLTPINGNLWGHPEIYTYAERPAKNDKGWVYMTKEPGGGLDANGNIDYKRKSILTGAAHTAVNFTYFRTFIDIPAGTDVDHLTVTIGKVDDGARMYIHNSKHAQDENNDGKSDGHHDNATDAKLGGSNFTVDFGQEYVAGEINTIVIIQEDQSASRNDIQGGITIKFDDQVIKPVTKTEWNSRHEEFEAEPDYTGDEQDQAHTNKFIKGSWSGANPENELSFLFRENGTAVITDDGDPIKATYSISSNGKNVTFTVGTETIVLEIARLTHSILEFKENGNEINANETKYGKDRPFTPGFLEGKTWGLKSSDKDLQDRRYDTKLVFNTKDKCTASQADEGTGKVLKLSQSYTINGKKMTLTATEMTKQLKAQGFTDADISSIIISGNDSNTISFSNLTRCNTLLMILENDDDGSKGIFKRRFN